MASRCFCSVPEDVAFDFLDVTVSIDYFPLSHGLSSYLSFSLSACCQPSAIISPNLPQNSPMAP
jgi:hypothetical protein